MLIHANLHADGQKQFPQSTEKGGTEKGVSLFMLSLFMLWGNITCHKFWCWRN